MKHLTLPVLASFLLLGCEHKQSKQAVTSADSVSLPKGTFAFDLAFLKKYKDVIVLGEGAAKVAIVRDYQGRVMTSTANGFDGTSYGWINYALIRTGTNQPHINPFGGEDRFWIGPEGGQYAVFFKKGDSFDFKNWQTPALIDTEAFNLVSVTRKQALFKKSGTLVNYQGFTFRLDIQRQVKLLDDDDIQSEFDISVKKVSTVAFESKNIVTNAGPVTWNRNTGLISIWILGMFTPSDHTTVVVPFEKSPDYRTKITDNYFGTIPRDRIQTVDGLILLKGDGRYRGKIGIPPSLARNVAGSYDAARHILTLVKFDVDKKEEYVNSKWEKQLAPYRGDAVNSYNDGPLADGSQLGPFYELESSSPARELKPGEKITHRHITLHLEGAESELNTIATKTLGVSLQQITAAFENK